MAVVATATVTATTTTTPEIIELPRNKHSMDLSSDSASYYLSQSSTSSQSPDASASDPNDNEPSVSSSPNASYQRLEIQSPAAVRSEEYRQLFRLPADEVLIEDFNCAIQENILIQGHIYLFLHYICFYSNIFGFETKKIIPLVEITTVRKAKTAGIFPNAIEIFVGEKKYFFASFLSRDEAFKLINDGWSQHAKGTEVILEKQVKIDGLGSQENSIVEIENVKELDGLDSSERDQANVIENDAEKALSNVSINLIHEAEPIHDIHAASSGKTSIWKQEDSDAPKVPDYYTKVAESTFPIKVEDFFSFYFSDEAVHFISLYHEKSGDKGFNCSLWRPHDIFGHTRDLSFQHPINLYFGAKISNCMEIQKFRVYRDSHMVIEVTQEVSDVPYSDYFRVETRWDVEKGADESNCQLTVYVNVAFLKRTVWKGKIVQTTIDECREAYGMWVLLAKELLKEKLKEPNEENTCGSISQDVGDHHIEGETNNIDSLEKTTDKDRRSTDTPYYANVNQQDGDFTHGINSSSPASWLRDCMMKLWSLLRSQSYLPLALVITFAVIFLMQLSIVMLLSRPQHIHVSSLDYGFANKGMKYGGGRSPPEANNAMAWLEKRMHHLKDEMYMVEARLEMMRQEHSQLKAHLKDLQELIKSR